MTDASFREEREERAEEPGYTLGELACHLEGEVVGDSDTRVTGVRTLERAGPKDLSFLTRPGYLEEASRSCAAALLVASDALLKEGGRSIGEGGPSYLVVENPSLALARVIRLFHPEEEAPAEIHPTAVLEPGAELHPTVRIGPYAVIGARSVVGAGSRIGAHAVIGRDCRLGEDVVLHPHVVLYDRTELGDRAVLHAGVVLGADGFGYVTHAGEHVKVPQVGRTVIEADVEVGALSAVDRALLEETRIGRGSKIDNLVQVGHNVETGRGCILCGQSGLAGSARLRDYVVVGGQSGVVGHHEIESGTQIAGKSMAMEQSGSGQIAGIPAVSLRKWRRQTALIGRLGEMARRLRALEKRFDRFTAEGAGTVSSIREAPGTAGTRNSEESER